MLGNSKRKIYICKLLSGLLHVPFDEIFNNSEYYKNELDKDSVDSKNERSDLILRLGDDYILVEMNNRDENLRNIEYSDRLYNNKIKVGEDKYVYPIVISISLNNFCYVDHDKPVEVYYVQNDEGELLVNKIYVQVFIPLLLEKWYTLGNEALDEFEKSLLVMTLTKRNEAFKLAKGDITLEKYLDEAKYAEKNDNYLREAYDHEVSNIKAARENGEEIGFAKGEKSGREKERKETIKSAKKLINDGVNKDLIIKTFNLTLDEQKLLD